MSIYIHIYTYPFLFSRMPVVKFSQFCPKGWLKVDKMTKISSFSFFRLNK